jgi:hypothetical protein
MKEEFCFGEAVKAIESTRPAGRLKLVDSPVKVLVIVPNCRILSPNQLNHTTANVFVGTTCHFNNIPSSTKLRSTVIKCIKKK